MAGLLFFMLLNLPIFLTWLRITFVPLMVCIVYMPQSVIGILERDIFLALIFLLASLTDWLDGFFARCLKQTSAFGAFLDPVADKLMVSVALLILLHFQRVSVVIAIIIIGREITISALREWMAKIGFSHSVAVNWIGKIKTACQMLSIPILLGSRSLVVCEKFYFLENVLPIIGTLMINVSAVLTLWSMIYYIRIAWPHLIKNV